MFTEVETKVKLKARKISYLQKRYILYNSVWNIYPKIGYI